MKTRGIVMIDAVVYTEDKHSKAEELNRNRKEERVTVVRERIEQILEKEVRPALRMDGGDIELKSFSEEDGILTVRFLGGCSGCPAAKGTLESVVEKAILEKVPEVRKIELDDSVSQDLLDFAKKILNHEI